MERYGWVEVVPTACAAGLARPLLTSHRALACTSLPHVSVDTGPKKAHIIYTLSRYQILSEEKLKSFQRSKR